MSDPYIAFGVGLILGLISGILICLPAKKKGRYYYDLGNVKSKSKDEDLNHER